MRTAAKVILAGISTVALAGGIGAGLAYADPSDPTPTPSASPTASASPSTKAEKKAEKKEKKGDTAEKEGRKRRGLLGSALHGEVTLAGKEHRVVVFQRGPAEKASATSITVKSADGYAATYAISGETKVRKDGEAAEAADLQAGDRVLVTAVKGGSTPTALRIRATD